MKGMEGRLNPLDAERFASLYHSVGWESPCRARVERAQENTLAALVALDRVTAVGMARLIGDGGIREQGIRVENAHPGRVR